jgi:hypothetical protein
MAGARDEYSTYLHLLVCYLEQQAILRILGELKAKQVMDFWATDHYTWVYQTVISRSRDIGQIVRDRKLILAQPARVSADVDMVVTCQVSDTRPVVTVVSGPLRFSALVHRSFRRHDALATVDAADIRGLGTARLLCVAELPHSRHGHLSRS